MPNLVTELVTQELERDFAEAEGMIFVGFGGLTVAESESLRGQLAEQGIRLRMVRNKLARRVLLERGHTLPDGALAGNVAIAMGDSESAILAAKVLTSREVKKAGKVTVRAGLMEGRILGPVDAELLAEVPDKDTLRARILACIIGPGRGIAVSLAALQSGLARVIQAHVDAQGGSGDAEAPAAEAPAAEAPAAEAPAAEAPAAEAPAAEAPAAEAPAAEASAEAPTEGPAAEGPEAASAGA